MKNSNISPLTLYKYNQLTLQRFSNVFTTFQHRAKDAERVSQFPQCISNKASFSSGFC